MFQSLCEGLIPLHMMCVSLGLLWPTLVSKLWFTEEDAEVLAGAKGSTRSWTANQAGNSYGAVDKCRTQCWFCDLG